jgi:RNA polymerase sigma factor (TIGR02999 family)
MDPPPFDELVRIAWNDLRALSRRSIARQQGAHRFADATSLLGEALGRLSTQRNLPDSRAQLHGLAKLAIRRALADRMRKGLAAKRDARAESVEPIARRARARAERSDPRREDRRTSVLEALDALHEADPRAAEVLFLTARAQMKAEAVAEVLGISVPTVERDLRAARAFVAAWIGREDE